MGRHANYPLKSEEPTRDRAPTFGFHYNCTGFSEVFTKNWAKTFGRATGVYFKLISF